MNATLCGISGSCIVGASHDEGEASALVALVAHLARDGVMVRVLCMPELRTECPWTNDWMLSIDGEPWIVEHTSLMQSATVIPRLRETERLLKEFISEEGRKHSIRVNVIVGPGMDYAHLDRKQGEAERRKAYERLKSFVASRLDLMSSVEDWDSENFEDGEGNRVNLIRLDPAGDHESLGYGFTGTWGGGPDRRAQFDQDIAPTIRRKLTKQVRKSPGVLEHVGLFLDQDDAGVGLVNIVLRAEDVRQALIALREEFPGVLDRVWLRRPDGQVVDLDLAETPVPPA